MNRYEKGSIGLNRSEFRDEFVSEKLVELRLTEIITNNIDKIFMCQTARVRMGEKRPRKKNFSLLRYILDKFKTFDNS